MASKSKRPADAAEQRQQADEMVRTEAAPPVLEAMSLAETRRILHELRVHQIELEVQNEELRRTQAELDAARARYFELYDLAPVGYVTLSKEGLIQEVNLAAAAMLGRAREALVGRPFSLFVARDDQSLYYHHRKQLLESGVRQTCELRMLTGDGSAFWMLLTTTTAPDAEGASVHYVTLNDITERKRAEALLHESEEWHRTILQTAMDGFFQADAQGHLLAVNEAYCRMSGYSEAELLALRISDLTITETAAGVIDHIAVIMAEGEDRFESRHRRKDGTLYDVEVCAQYRTSGGGQFVVFLRDITQRKQAEAARASLETQLRQAQKMESIGLLAGGVAHEFNNKLMGIMNYVEVCQDELPPEHPIRHYLDEITIEAQHSADIVGQLLAFARKQIIAPQRLDLNDALAGMVKMLRRLMGEDIALAWRPGANLWRVNVDPGQLKQVLANLCINARNAIAGVGEVTIGTANTTLDGSGSAEHADAAPGEYVKLEVCDTGCGMRQDVLAHIFEPFFTTSEVGKGTGLGLATVYGIVEQNKGHIEVRSEVGKGTVFSIYLPRAAAEAAAEPVAAPQEKPPRGTETILLVEDERSIRITAREFLKYLGYTVLAAETPDEALPLVSAHSGRLDLLITDVILPGMNGPALAGLLAERCPHLKCLFISGYAADVTTHRGTLGADVPFLPKPFSRGDLARKVREVLDGE
jgi:PAS domain S-box-containing protein